jgi:hypothetical protein
MQLVEMRRLEHRVAVAGQVAVSLVIGDHQDDVGFWGGNYMADKGKAENKEYQWQGVS